MTEFFSSIRVLTPGFDSFYRATFSSDSKFDVAYYQSVLPKIKLELFILITSVFTCLCHERE